jgi:hypothetical protein
MMHLSAHRLVREVGTALAVLALYVLTLLLPMHQAAALQRDLDQLGYTSMVSWSVCGPLHVGKDNSQTPTAVKCPAAGIGKFEFHATLPPPPPRFEPPTGSVAVRYSPAPDGVPAGPPDHFGQSRAPPVLS